MKINKSLILLTIVSSVLLLSGCYTSQTVSVPVYETRRVPVYSYTLVVNYQKLDKNILTTPSGYPYKKPVNVVFFGVYHNSSSYADKPELNQFINNLDKNSTLKIIQPISQFDVEKAIPERPQKIHDRNFEQACYNNGFYFGFYFLKTDNKYAVIIYRLKDGVKVGMMLLQNSNNSTVYKDFNHFIGSRETPKYIYNNVITGYKDKKVQTGTTTKTKKKYDDDLSTYLEIGLIWVVGITIALLANK